MPHGDPVKPWATAALTEEQWKFVEEAKRRVGGNKTDFVRNAVLDMAEKILKRPAPARGLRDLHAGHGYQLEEARPSVAKDPEGVWESIVDRLVRDAKKKLEDGS